MIPCIEVGAIPLGPLRLQPFGLLVAAAIVVGWALMSRRAKAFGYDEDEFRVMRLWVVIVGFFFAHALDEIFYHPADFARAPLSFLYVWRQGLSSLGGFIGALVGGILWKYVTWRPVSDDRTSYAHAVARPILRRRPLPLLPFADIIVPCFAIAWTLGRLGCAIVHDHVGARVPVGTPFAVAFPGPGDIPWRVFGPLRITFGAAPRYDLGLLELGFTAILAIAIVAIWRRRFPIGAYVIGVSVAYAPARFALDFLRDTRGDSGDLRYGALTFAQWGCVALLVFAMVLASRIATLEQRRNRRF